MANQLTTPIELHGFRQSFPEGTRPTWELALFFPTEYWEKADLVVEVVSDNPKDPVRDYETKAVEYAAAGIGQDPGV